MIVQHAETHLCPHHSLVFNLPLGQLAFAFLVILRGVDLASSQIGCAFSHLNLLLEQHVRTDPILSLRAGLLVLVCIAALDGCAQFDRRTRRVSLTRFILLLSCGIMQLFPQSSILMIQLIHFLLETGEVPCEYLVLEGLQLVCQLFPLYFCTMDLFCYLLV